MIFSLGFIAVLFSKNPDMLRHQMENGMAALMIFFCWQMYVKLRSVSVALGFFMFAILALRSAVPVVPFPDWLVNAGSSSLLEFLSITLVAMYMHRDTVARFLECLGVICLGTSIILLVAHIFHPPFLCYAWQNNASADASFLAVLYPMLAFRRRGLGEASRNVWWRLFLATTPVVAIALSGSSTAIGALLVATASYTWFYRRSRTSLIAAGILTLGALSGLLFLHKSFLVDHGRWVTWIEMMTFWKANVVQPWFGSGSGSFFVIGPEIQNRMGTHGDQFFAWMHNEYLQVIFEQGWLGFICLVLVGVFALKRAYNKPWLFSSLTTYAFVMLTQFPFRYFAPALIGAVLIRETCEVKTRTT